MAFFDDQMMAFPLAIFFSKCCNLQVDLNAMQSGDRELGLKSLIDESKEMTNDEVKNNQQAAAQQGGEETLHRRIVAGEDKAVTAISRAIQIGSFIFAGPTVVGKMLDMSELMEKHLG